MRRPVLWALAVLLSLAAVSPPPGAASLLTPALFFDEPHADLTLCVPGKTTDRIQELHITVGHILCSLIESALF